MNRSMMRAAELIASTGWPGRRYMKISRLISVLTRMHFGSPCFSEWVFSRVYNTKARA
jgi:hypothetical protein